MDGKPGDSGAVEHFGKELIDKGYHHLGSEPLYSGVSGQVLAGRHVHGCGVLPGK